MSGVKHTRGPWKIDFGYPRGNPYGISAKSDGRTVTRFGAFARPSTPEALANARLIAVAPCMFEYILSSAQNGCATAQEIVTRATGDRPEKGGAL